jgi:hypothetical protein
MAEIVAIWRDSLHTILDRYERKKISTWLFFPLLFVFFIILNIACYWWAIYTAFPYYMQTHEASHYIKLQIPVGFFGALFDSPFLFCNHLDHQACLSCRKTSEYVFHLSLDLIIAIVATFWVLFVFTFGGWLISIWENAPEELTSRGAKYTSRAVQAIQDPMGRENAKNIYFGVIMGVSAALPTCFHILLFLYSLLSKIKNSFQKPKQNTEESSNNCQ